ncbi:Iron(II)-dependent oxidoreductase EgtB [Pirellulimonas nuda]|uniref:Iron(II)-dependent oxidoreductase EgtB n=1 Tax=Pirellulimonas nuda TaxID=2528009 RepID=A0A518D5J1_9BACT|nr:SUMF1/EgtB/PvdO family nonheme iron enzyme [Pirellulimonas nuda]QDU86747.1 Iron(II)-dependent oxidoreductase EgtB [Pirellulimonas nuda]
MNAIAPAFQPIAPPAPVVISAFGVVLCFAGAWLGSPVMSAAGVAGLFMFARQAAELLRLDFPDPWRLVGWGRGARPQGGPPPAPQGGVSDADRRVAAGDIALLPETIRSTEDLIDSMLTTGRYALLLRPEVSDRLSDEQIMRAVRALDDSMSLVPGGRVLLGITADRATLGGELTGDVRLDDPSAIAEVAPCYIDRYCVTNRQYQQFVDSGGYEQLEYWLEEALPAMFDFVDQTGEPGPRDWRNGAYRSEGPTDGADLPVVGVSWYEALAYARWLGKRLPIEAEWTKAGAWPVEASPGRIAQRRYPWGESFDARRANLWCSRVGSTQSVYEYEAGASVGGVCQLVGNVWEWTATSLSELAPRGIDFPSALKTVRGGAYNTYFENQATCHFQSAEHPLSRRPNIGIRLALGMESLAAINGRVAEGAAE